MRNQPIKLSIIDDDKLVATLLADFLGSNEDIEILSVLCSGDDFCHQIGTTFSIPDVILLDLKMSKGDGISVLDFMRKQYPETKIIVLSSYFRISYTGFIFKLGAHAFLPKEIKKTVLLNTIREVNDKGSAYNVDQLNVIRSQIVAIEKPKIAQLKKDNLSVREIEVLQLICQQLTAKEIALKLFITDRTVEGHKSNLLNKTSTKNTIGLILYALRHKLIDPDSILFFE